MHFEYKKNSDNECFFNLNVERDYLEIIIDYQTKQTIKEIDYRSVSEILTITSIHDEKILKERYIINNERRWVRLDNCAVNYDIKSDSLDFKNFF